MSRDGKAVRGCGGEPDRAGGATERELWGWEVPGGQDSQSLWGNKERGAWAAPTPETSAPLAPSACFLVSLLGTTYLLGDLGQVPLPLFLHL